MPSSYFKKHISRLLSHTIRVGSGGAESAIGAEEPAGAELDGDIDTDEVAPYYLLHSALSHYYGCNALMLNDECYLSMLRWIAT